MGFIQRLLRGQVFLWRVSSVFLMPESIIIALSECRLCKVVIRITHHFLHQLSRRQMRLRLVVVELGIRRGFVVHSERDIGLRFLQISWRCFVIFLNLDGEYLILVLPYFDSFLRLRSRSGRSTLFDNNLLLKHLEHLLLSVLLLPFLQYSTLVIPWNRPFLSSLFGACLHLLKALLNLQLSHLSLI